MERNIDFWIAEIRARQPLIHCITNPVTINDCANMLLATGASPTMAYHEEESAEIASHADGLVLNLGHTTALAAMLRAGLAANEKGIPVALDPVGAGASRFRLNLFRQLTREVQPAVIRGNASEIRALAEGMPGERGVDVSRNDKLSEENLASWKVLAKELAARLSCIVVISGETDLVASAEECLLLRGGCAEMSRITGCGCMLTSLMGAFLAVDPAHPLEAAAAAVAAMNTAGEKAKEKTDRLGGGTMTFRTQLIDTVSLL